MSEEKKINELLVVEPPKELEVSKAQIILNEFSDIRLSVNDLIEEASKIVITSADQKDEIARAREIRLALVKKRTGAAEIKTRLKTSINLEGGYIDSLNRSVEKAAKPAEADLLAKEKFVENQEKERIAKLSQERLERILPYLENQTDTDFYKFGEMPDTTFNDLLSGAISNYNARIEAQKKVEEERIAKEKEIAEEQERIRAENEILKKDAERKEEALEVERKAQAEVLRLEKEKAEFEKKKADDEIAKIQAAAEAKIKDEKATQDKILADQKAKADKVLAEIQKAKDDAAKKAKEEKAKLEQQLKDLIECPKCGHKFKKEK